ncbi:hypothetical protein NP603_13860 [Methylomonas sp. SURF-1]|uniref:Mor transcription activator domain-containing protein n=1 Tax=Methylomonas aurea TaxID=2952224 RepID=A0ABT1UIZ2_9GAMM|nr:hypothetical protein [Methylomonas sp. SURF-1]MCQ8182203.1 hypothetical protein [Methylomonas sp. SURF-1]
MYLPFNQFCSAKLDRYGRPLQSGVIGVMVSEGTRANGKRTVTHAMAAELYQPARPRPTDEPGLALYAPAFRNMNDFAESVIRDFKPHNGGNFRQLAKRYGMTLVQMYLFIHARCPDLYEKAVNGKKSCSAFDVSKLSTSAASTPSRTSHHIDHASSNPVRWGSWKKSYCSRHSVLGRSPANKAAVPHTDRNVRISGDMSGLSLTLAPANGQVLELRFASDARNADTHTSCRD